MWWDVINLKILQILLSPLRDGSRLLESDERECCKDSCGKLITGVMLHPLSSIRNPTHAPDKCYTPAQVYSSPFCHTRLSVTTSLIQLSTLKRPACTPRRIPRSVLPPFESIALPRQ